MIHDRRGLAALIIMAAVLLLLLLLTAGACASPRGTPCDEEGAQMFTSKYGNFICKDGWWHEA